MPNKTKIHLTKKNPAIPPLNDGSRVTANVQPSKSRTQKTIATIIHEKIAAAEQKKSTALLLDRSRYQYQSRRPLVCLIFVFPMILVYEFATIFSGGSAVRSGVDQWLNYLLSNIGVGEFVVLPLVTAAALIIAHHRIDDHWRIRCSVLGGMLIEAIGLGLMLFWAASALRLLFYAVDVDALAAGATSRDIGWSATMAMVGTGIYEELFFRLILLVPAIHYASKLTNHVHGRWIGILAVSLLFAALHYDFINPAGSQFDSVSFVFRLVASGIFSILFLHRGFGIAVGTHVAYDVLTQL